MSLHPAMRFKMSIALEHKNQPAFRREVYISGLCGEGWAVYAGESWAFEMGMYGNAPTTHSGMLSYQAWRACTPLVVDTGIHAGGWTRAQAQAYLHDKHGADRSRIETEVDRYIGWPGQALFVLSGRNGDREGADAR